MKMYSSTLFDARMKVEILEMLQGDSVATFCNKNTRSQHLHYIQLCLVLGQSMLTQIKQDLKGAQ